MDNVDKILHEYTLLRIKDLEGVLSDDENLWCDDGGYQILGEHFEWIRFSDRRRSTQDRIYDGSAQVFCANARKTKGVVEALNGAIMRMPNISSCYGDESIMVTNDMMKDIGLAPNLGIIASPATIMDLTKHKHEGFTALSFHKVFSVGRVAQRLLQLPASERTIIPIRRGKHDMTLLIHKAVLNKWQAAGIDEIEYDTSDFEVPLKEVLSSGQHYRAAKSLCYNSMDNYQQNREGL